MSFWHGFITITALHLLAAASPGPDFILVTRQSLLHGRKAGLLASLGIALGLSIHIIYSAAGLAAVVSHSVKWMTAIKLAGGAYLIYLGIKGLLSKQVSVESPSSSRWTLAPAASRQVLRGFLCNALNPKAPIYFLALFTLVLSPNMPAAVLAIYGVWLMVLQWLWFSIVATVFAHGALRSKLLNVRHWIDRTFGALLIALGLKVLTSR